MLIDFQKEEKRISRSRSVLKVSSVQLFTSFTLKNDGNHNIIFQNCVYVHRQIKNYLRLANNHPHVNALGIRDDFEDHSRGCPNRKKKTFTEKKMKFTTIFEKFETVHRFSQRQINTNLGAFLTWISSITFIELGFYTKSFQQWKMKIFETFQTTRTKRNTK